jgi:hypothetical protein
MDFCPKTNVFGQKSIVCARLYCDRLGRKRSEAVRGSGTLLEAIFTHVAVLRWILTIVLLFKMTAGYYEGLGVPETFYSVAYNWRRSSHSFRLRLLAVCHQRKPPPPSPEKSTCHFASRTRQVCPGLPIHCPLIENNATISAVSVAMQQYIV